MIGRFFEGFYEEFISPILIILWLVFLILGIFLIISSLADATTKEEKFEIVKVLIIFIIVFIIIRIII